MAASTKRRRNVDPDVAHHRAVKAARTRTSLDHYVAKVVENAPALNAEQLDRLRQLLPAATDGSAHAAA